MNAKSKTTFVFYLIAFSGLIAEKIWGEPLKPFVGQFFTFITGNDRNAYFLLVSSLLTFMLFIGLRDITKRKSNSFLHIAGFLLMLLPILGYFILLSYIYHKEISVLAKNIWMYIEPCLGTFST